MLRRHEEFRPDGRSFKVDVVIDAIMGRERWPRDSGILSLFLRELFCTVEERLFLFFAEPARDCQKVREQVVLLVEEAGGDKECARQALTRLYGRGVLALFVLIHAGAGGELVNAGMDAKLLLGEARAQPRLFQASGENCIRGRCIVRHPVSFPDSLRDFTK